MTVLITPLKKNNRIKLYPLLLKELAFLTTIFFSSISSSMASTQIEMNSEILIEPISGLTYQRDNHGNVWPNINNMEESSLKTYLTTFVVCLKEDKALRRSAFLINLRLPEFGKSEVLKTVGFTLHRASDNELLWKIENGSSTKNFMKNCTETGVIILKGGNF